jgi:hypothetical protein
MERKLFLEINLSPLIQIGPTLKCRHQAAEGISNDTNTDPSLTTISTTWIVTILFHGL